jgi:hypothetical protein
MLIGPETERWDAVFIAEYPSVSTFVVMVRDPAYREAVKHRQIAVETSRLIRMQPRPSGAALARNDHIASPQQNYQAKAI